MVYSFARVSAVVGMRVEDYYQQGKRWWLRLQGKRRQTPRRAGPPQGGGLSRRGRDRGRERRAPVALDAAGRRDGRAPDEPGGCVPDDQAAHQDRRARRGHCHTFRATGITAYLLNGGTLERAQAIAGHESPRTTKLYDRTADEVTIEDIEKIGI